MTYKSVEYRSPQLETSSQAQAALEVAEVAARGGTLHSVRDAFGDARFGQMHVTSRDGSSYVVFDKTSGMYIKRYGNLEDADIQRRSLNMMHDKLAAADLGIRAVQVMAVVDHEAGFLPPAAVIEPATGDSLRRIWIENHGKDAGEFATLADEVSHVRTRLDAGLGKFASRVLVNDLKRGDNLGGNIFRYDQDGQPIYTIIDQPYVYGPTARFYAALRTQSASR